MQPPQVADHSAVDSVIGAIYAIGRLMRQRTASAELDPGSFWLLKTLDQQGPLRVTDLAGCAGLDTSTVSRHVAQLERTGVVARTPDPDDRRAQLVQLSDSGRDRLRQAMTQRRALLAASIQSWPQDEINQFARLLDRFVSDIENTTPQENA
jgi:DNA-binding MarR family transcriptional regulator